MVQNGDTKANGKVSHRSVDEIEKFDKDFVLSKMKKVGYRNSHGVLVLPEDYDDDIDYVFE